MASKRPFDDNDKAELPGEEDIYSMVDVLAEETDLEESASAVLGGSDDKNCTYLQGYVNRQALYACVTCCPNDSKGLAGVCLACCLECHDGHELIELYTKRNFRCDCGNEKFPDGFVCKLMATKIASNEDNQYNHNFIGKYCTCAKPYPDPDDDVEDEMIQCCVCEDWYHSRHLGSPTPSEFSEMVCDSCMHKLDFLWAYTRPVADAAHFSCSYEHFVQQVTVIENKGAAFFQDGWRLNLCKCSKCNVMYSEMQVSFLMDEADSVKAYEEKGLKKSKTQYEKGMEELSKLDRVQQVEVLSEYHDMKSKLKEYLRGFAASGEVVTKEHISNFFEEMNKKKRRKVVVPSNCR